MTEPLYSDNSPSVPVMRSLDVCFILFCVPSFAIRCFQKYIWQISDRNKNGADFAAKPALRQEVHCT